MKTEITFNVSELKAIHYAAFLLCKSSRLGINDRTALFDVMRKTRKALAEMEDPHFEQT